MDDYLEGIIVTGLFIVIIVVLVILGARAHATRQVWLDAHCKVIGEMSGSVGVGTGLAGGKVAVTTTYIPGKTGYQCDDNKQYWE